MRAGRRARGARAGVVIVLLGEDEEGSGGRDVVVVVGEGALFTVVCDDEPASWVGEGRETDAATPGLGEGRH